MSAFLPLHPEHGAGGFSPLRGARDQVLPISTSLSPVSAYMQSQQTHNKPVQEEMSELFKCLQVVWFKVSRAQPLSLEYLEHLREVCFSGPPMIAKSFLASFL